MDQILTDEQDNLMEANILILIFTLMEQKPRTHACTCADRHKERKILKREVDKQIMTKAKILLIK